MLCLAGIEALTPKYQTPIGSVFKGGKAAEMVLEKELLLLRGIIKPFIYNLDSIVLQWKAFHTVLMPSV